MESRKIYEYVTLVAEWYANNLDKGTRLYYDHTSNSYVYHYEFSQDTSNSKYNSKTFEVTDYSLSLDIVDKNIANGNLEVGPEIGELETNKE